LRNEVWLAAMMLKGAAMTPIKAFSRPVSDGPPLCRLRLGIGGGAAAPLPLHRH
jgi:hypothetical protein